MARAELEKKLHDWEYERRLTRSWIHHLFMVLPLAVYVGISYLELRYLSVVALGIAACCYAIVSALTHWLARRDALRGMRREGVIDERYEPPQF